jgi:hypothetical protein
VAASCVGGGSELRRKSFFVFLGISGSIAFFADTNAYMEQHEHIGSSLARDTKAYQPAMTRCYPHKEYCRMETG